MYRNVFSQISSAQKNRSERGKSESERQEVENLLALRNDKTNADEAAIFIRAILYLLTAFVIYLGFEYYSKTFGEMFSPGIATVFAICLPAIVEIGKIILAAKFLRACFFGWIGVRQHWSAVCYWFFVGAIAFGSFWWSYSISTGGIKEVAKENATIKNRQDSLKNILAEATAVVDEQISEVQASDLAAGPLKNKKGRTNWGAQPIKDSNAKSLAALYAQKEEITKQVTSDYQQTAGEVKIKVSLWSQFVERFGGWGEWGACACLFAIAFFERRLYEANKSAVSEEEENEEIRTPPPPHQNAQYSGNGQRQTASNSAQQQRYYFNRDTPTGNVNSALPTDEGLTQQPLWPDEQKTVPQPVETVAQQNNLSYADSVLEVCRQAIQRDVANFNNPQAKAETVAKRIYDALDAALAPMRQEGFAPTYHTGLRLYSYLEGTVWPLLNVKGHPYDRQRIFTERLYAAFKPQENTV